MTLCITDTILKRCRQSSIHNHSLQINVREYRRAIIKGQSRKTGNKGYTRRRKAKQKHNTICVGHHYTQTNTNNVNKTCNHLQTTVISRSFQHTSLLKISHFSCALKDFLPSEEEVGDLKFEQVPFNHPLFIMYSSGTTGAPKCMVHSVGVRKENILHFLY